jgi:hypothetical protein
MLAEAADPRSLEINDAEGAEALRRALGLDTAG